ncbi:hypothetical protein CYMTET_20149 [Cymbomonas tetramitiformis]|uniref:Mitochondrial carrier protein n=1 Tax=Cymbomonas tetramitiformis TaxID=36881 RepID=A0AAE0G5Z2_9CHLO|nr:hypothetical protein CYMTET_20149 [Cymbomonas tetramitiformis]
MRKLYDEIDVNQDGKLTESALLKYTSQHHLPSSYVNEFIRAAGGVKRSVAFNDFVTFTQKKEASLRESFNAIDVNGDGAIAMDEPEAALDKIRVCQGYCPQTLFTRSPGFTRMIKVKRSSVARMLRAAVQNDQVSNSSCTGSCATVDGKSVVMDYDRFHSFFLLLPDDALLFDRWMDASCTRFRGCDVGGTVQVANKASREQGVYGTTRHLVAGAVAGAISRTATAPMEVLRLRMMVGGNSQGGLSAHVSKLWCEAKATRGVVFFAGNGANVARSTPQKSIDFVTFAAYKSAFRQLSILPNESVQTLAAGALAGATSCLVLYPLEVARSRLIMQTGDKVSAGVFKTILEIQRKEGRRALYMGLKPSLLGIIPEAAIAYGCSDLLKQAYGKLAQVPADEIGVIPAMYCGMLSAFTGQAVAYPLEVIAKRMQCQGCSVAERTVVGAARNILREEGVTALYRGIIPASVKVLPMAMVSFGVYEVMTQLL